MTSSFIGKITAFALAAAACASPTLGASLRAGPGSSDSGLAAGTGRTISLTKGQSKIVELPQDASEIFVGDPKVANAVVRSTRRLYIIAVDNGETSIFAMNKAGQQIAAYQVSVGSSGIGVGVLQQIIDTALPKNSIVVRSVGGTVVLTGSVASAGDAKQAEDIANGFMAGSQDDSSSSGGTSSFTSKSGPDGGATGTFTSQSQSAAPPINPKSKVVNALTIKGKDQVMLKVSIVEIQRAVLKQLGVNQDAAWSTGTFGLTTPLSRIGLSDSSIGTLAEKFTSGNNSLTTTLRAFERYGVSHILAEPTVTAISGENAKFTAGGEIPVPTSETCAPAAIGFGSPECTVGIAFKQYGVTLNFAPVVLSEGRILLRIATEVTEIDPDRVFNFTNVTVNGFTTRKNETTVELPSGGSIVTAGLLSTNTRHVIAGLPALMNLPVLGALFRSRDYQRDETELMIVVTPYIARSLSPEQIAKPDDGFSDATDPQSWFLGRVNRLYSTTSNPQALQNFRGRVGFIND